MNKMTFSGIVADLAFIVNRSPEDIGDLAKLSVNMACKYLNRDMDFLYSYEQVAATYTSGAVLVPFSTLYATKDILSIHLIQLTSSGDIVRLVDRGELNKKILQNQQVTESGTPVITSRSGMLGTVVGTNLMLYPTPASAVSLTLTCKMVIDDLVDDSDTNYLLTYMPDLVMSKARILLATYIADADKFALYSKELETTLPNTLGWNSSLSKDKLETF